MRLELRKLHHSKSLSDETPAYTAQVFIDDKYAFFVSNHGHGGCDQQDQKGRYTAAEVDAWLKANVPPVKSEYFADGLPVDLELWCHMRIDEAQNVADLKRLLAAKIVFTKKATGGLVYCINCKSTDAKRKPWVEQVAAKPDTALVLNQLPFDEAMKIYMATNQ